MKISIVTVCRNSESTIRDTIESVLSQTYRDIEYIVVDGCSTDGTVSIIDEYRDRIAHVVSEPDNGIYDAMNKGIGMATGDFVGILNSDDFFVSTDTIEEMASFLQANPSLDGAYADVVYVKRNRPDEITRFYSSKNFSPWQLRIGIMFPHATFYVKRRLFNELGPYKLEYRIVADFELIARFLVHGVVLGRHSRIMVKMRNGGASNADFRSIVRQNFDIVRACRENGIYTNIILLMLKIPSKLMSYIRIRDRIFPEVFP